jgi:uncharacterized protein YkwD
MLSRKLARLALAGTVLCGALASTGRANAASWSRKTTSPRVVASKDPAYDVCGAPDEGLIRVARELLHRRMRGASPPDQAQVRAMLRRAGVPQVWPRAWSVAGVHDEAQLRASLKRWAGSTNASGNARCGFARGADSSGEPVVTAVQVDAQADLRPLPRRARSSDWIRFEGRMLRQADAVKVTLLGPTGRPKRVLASLSDGVIRSRFRLDRSGRWLVQAMAHTAEGPRPVLESVIFVDVDPAEAPAPKKRKRARGAQTSKRLLGLLNSARKVEGLAQLKRDRRLDTLAAEHAAALAKAGRIAHELGAGSPEQRVAASDVGAHEVGENLASAATVEAAHRALWDSPSHRENMLDPAFGRVGVGLAKDRRGRLWVVELMTD